MSCSSINDDCKGNGGETCEIGFGLYEWASHGLVEEDEGMLSLPTYEGPGCDLESTGRGAESRSDSSSARASSSSWERSELACSLSECADNSRAIFNSSSSFNSSGRSTGGASEGKDRGAVWSVSRGAVALRLR